MKVLITTECYSPIINGVVTSVINLKKELKRLGHEVRVLTLSDTNQSYETEDETYMCSMGTGKIYPGTRVALPSDNQYIKKLLDWSPDIIHSQSEFSTFLMAHQIAKKSHIPIVHTYHTVYEDYTHYFSPVKKWGKSAISVFTNKVLEHTDCVIAPTEKVHTLLVGYGVKQKIEVVPTGIDVDKFSISIDATEKMMFRKKLGIPNDDHVLVFVGRIAKEKNLEEILQYVSRLIRKDLTLLIVGDGPYRGTLEQYAGELGISDRVIFTGMISPEKVGYYYQLGDVFVSASNSETQGLTYIEALLNGVPALCRKDSCLENVIKNGVNGWQYESFEQFSKMLDFILSYDHDRFSKNARTYAIKDFSSETFAKNIEQVYRNTIRRYQERYGIENKIVNG